MLVVYLEEHDNTNATAEGAVSSLLLIQSKMVYPIPHQNISTHSALALPIVHSPS